MRCAREMRRRGRCVLAAIAVCWLGAGQSGLLLAAPDDQAGSHGGGAGQTAPAGTAATSAAGFGGNAWIVITSFDLSNNRLDTWQGEARWRDADSCRPCEYTGIRYGSTISWRDGEVDESTLRIAVSRDGSGGQSLQQWMPVRTHQIHILVTPVHAGTGSSPAGRAPTRAASLPPGTSGSAPPHQSLRPPGSQRPASMPRPAARTSTAMKILAAERKRALDAAAEWRRMRSNAGDTSLYRPSAGTGTSRDRGNGQSYPAGMDAANTDVAADGPAGHGQAGSRQGASRHGPAATRGTGVEAGRPLGDKDGSTDPSWVPPPPGNSISDNPARVPMAGGKPHGSAIGRQGGTGHLYGFWRGIIDFPASVAAAINLAVIVADANVMGFGRRMLGRVVGGMTGAVLRRELGDEARRFAAGRMRTLSAQIEQSPGFDALPASRQKQLLADIAADIEHSYYNQAGSYFGRQARESADHAAGHAGGVAAHNRQLARQNAAAYQAMEQAAQDNSAELQARLAREHATAATPPPRAAGSARTVTPVLTKTERGQLPGESSLLRRGLGNIGSHGPMSADQALELGHAWVGKAYKEVGPKGSGVFRSADGARQFRITNADLAGTHGTIGPHVHFEALEPVTGRVVENLHIPLLP